MLDSLELRNLILSFAPHEQARGDIENSYKLMVADGRSENIMCIAAIDVLHDGIFDNNWPWAPKY